MSQDIYLISKDQDLVNHFNNQREVNGAKIESIGTLSAIGSKRPSNCPLLVIDSEGSWEESLKKLEAKRKKEQGFYVIISASPSLKKTASQISEIAVRLNGYVESDHVETELDLKKDTKDEKAHELHLSTLLEKKLSDFVRKVKHGRPKNLYNLLISEFEKPLFSLALQETDGNQVQAAELLGVNRNTLRKKIKEFKIKIKKDKKQ